MSRLRPIFPRAAACTVLVLALLLSTAYETATQIPPKTPSPVLSLNQKRDQLIKLYRSNNTFSMSFQRDSQLVPVSEAELFEHQKSIKGRLVVSFDGDMVTKNTDAALKEFFSLFSNDVMNPIHGMFYSNASFLDPSIAFGSTVQMDRFPHLPLLTAQFMPVGLDMNSFQLLRCVGQVIAMAILNEHFLDITFPSALYKMILGKKIPRFEFSLCGSSVFEKRVLSPSMKRHQHTDMRRVFKLSYFPPKQTRESVIRDAEPIGIYLSFANKEVIQDMVYMIHSFAEDSTKFPMVVLCQGIFDVIPQHAFSTLFDEHQLATLITGDTRLNTVGQWQGFAKNLFANESEGDPQTMEWFWDCVRAMDKDMQSRLLSFITGNSRLPVGVLQDHPDQSLEPRPMYIHIKWSGKTDSPPTSDPYTNTLFLSTYSSYELMKRQLVEASTMMGGIPTWFVSAALYR